MSNYKRHAQGGRFKRGEFGDLGLRAYKDQQDRQIQHLKDQNRQEQLYSQQHLQQIRGSGAKELEHNRMLQGLEEDVGNLALQNTKIRADREVEAIKGEAAEAGKKAKFWKDFSTTYSQQYIAAAGTLIDEATTLQMQKQVDVVKNHPGFQKAINDFAHLNKLSSKKLQESGVGVYFDPTIDQKTKSDFFSHLADLGLRMNHKTKKAVAKMVLDDWDTQHARLKDLAAKNDAPWNEETIGHYYYTRARELLTQLGISHTSEAGQVLLRGIDKEEFDKREELTQKGFVARDTKYKTDLKERAQGLVGKMDFSAVKGSKNIVSANGYYYTDYSDDFNDLIMYEGTSWTADSKGNPVDPDLRTPANLREDFEVIAENWIKAGVFKSKEQAVNHLLNVHIPGAKVKVKPDGSIEYSKKDSWGGKHPQLVEKIDDWWREYSKDRAVKTKQSLENEDNDALAEILRRRQLDRNDENYIDVTDPKQIKALQIQYGHLEKTTDLLGDYEVFNQTDKDQRIVNANLNSLYKDNKIENLSKYIQHLPDDQKEIWQSKLDQVKLLHRNGFDEAGLKSLSKEYLNEMVGVENIKNASSTARAHYTFVQQGIQQEILYQLSLVADKDMSDAEKLQAVDQALRNQMQLDKTGGGERGTGIFRRTASGTKTTFLAYWDEDEDDKEGSVATKEDIETKLKNGSTDYNTLIEELGNSSKKGLVTFGTGANQVSKYIVGIDEADMALRSLKSGTPIKFNATVEHIYTNQPKGKGKYYSKRDIWNNIFKSLGINEEIPQGYEEFQTYKIESSTVLNADTSRMTAPNKEAVCILEQCAEYGIIDLNQPSKESQEVTRQKEIRQKNPYRNPFFPF